MLILLSKAKELAMTLQKGDPVWLPQAVLLYRGTNNPLAVKWNDEPRVGLYLDKAEYEGFIVIMVEGDKWVIEEKHARVILREVRNASKVG
jgi:hypothetical protein